MSLKGAVEALRVLRGKVADFFVIDKSLSVSGACADAKAVGDKFEAFDNALAKKANTDYVDELKIEIEAVRGEVDAVETIFGEREALELEDESALDNTMTPGTYWVVLPDDEGMLIVYFSNFNGAAVQEFVSVSGTVRRRVFYNEWTEWDDTCADKSYNTGTLSVAAGGTDYWAKDMSELKNYTLVAFDIRDSEKVLPDHSVLACAYDNTNVYDEVYYNNIVYRVSNGDWRFTALLDKETGRLTIDSPSSDITIINVRGII